MGQKLSEQINRYFNLMEKIREQLYRVLPVSDRYMCIVSFNTNLQALQCVLVSKQSLMEAKLLDGLTGKELTTYGQYMQLAEEWVAGGMEADYPFDQNQDVYAEYVALTRDTPEKHENFEDDDEDDLDEQELGADVSWTSIARMSKHEALAAVSALEGETLKRVAQEAGVASDATGKALRSLLKGRVLNLT